MVYSTIKQVALAKKSKGNKNISIKKKEELKHLLSQLNAVTPICNKNNKVKSTDVVFKAVEYINQLHRKIAEKKGLEALQQIQKNARNKAIQQLMSMKNKTKNISQVKMKCFWLIV